jgi:hypothetical protein
MKRGLKIVARGMETIVRQTFCTLCSAILVPLLREIMDALENI